MRPFFAVAFVVVITFVHGLFLSTAASAEDNFEKLIARPGIICVLDLETDDRDAQRMIGKIKAGLSIKELTAQLSRNAKKSVYGSISTEARMNEGVT